MNAATETRTGARSLYTITCAATGETQTVVVCPEHAREMPLVDRDRVRAKSAEDDCACEFCPPRHRDWGRDNYLMMLVD